MAAKSIFKTIFTLFQEDPQAIKLLGTGPKVRFLDHLRYVTCASVKGLDLLPDDKLIRGITSRCTRAKGPDSDTLKIAAAAYKEATSKARAARVQFISEAKLNWHPSLRDAFLQKIPTHIMEPLATPYPSLDHHISESPEIRRKWYNHLTTGYQPDQRKARHPILDLDPANLVKDIGPEENACFRNKSGELVGLVIRNFCTSKAAVVYADAAAAAQLPDRRNVRVSSFSFGDNLQ